MLHWVLVCLFVFFMLSTCLRAILRAGYLHFYPIYPDLIATPTVLQGLKLEYDIINGYTEGSFHMLCFLIENLHDCTAFLENRNTIYVGGKIRPTTCYLFYSLQHFSICIADIVKFISPLHCNLQLLSPKCTAETPTNTSPSQTEPPRAAAWGIGPHLTVALRVLANTQYPWLRPLLPWHAAITSVLSRDLL